MKKLTFFLLAVAMLFSVLAFFPAGASALYDYSIVRVGLSVSSSSVNFIPQGNYTILEQPLLLLSGQTYTVRPESGRLSLYLGSNLLIHADVITVKEHTPATGAVNTVRIYNTGHGRNIDYPGSIVFRLSGGSVRTINHVYMETYLKGVVPHEMSNSFPLEALKAQAVVARTYAASAMKDNENNTYDIGDISSSQVYKGYETDNPRSDQAVDATHGEVLKTGALGFANAYFSASNGGQAELTQHIWTPGTPKAYQRLIDDPKDVENPSSPWERIFYPADIDTTRQNKARMISYTQRGDTSPEVSSKAENYLKYLLYWTFTPEDMQKYGIASYNDIVIKGVTAMQAHTHDNFDGENHDMPDLEGRICRDYIKADVTALVQVTRAATPEEQAASGSPTVAETVTKNVTMDMRELDGSIRQHGIDFKAFSNNSLRLFVVEPVGGSIPGFAVYHRRYGHGVGMSQRGAQQRANDGDSYMDIVNFYFPGFDQSGGHFSTKPMNPPALTPIPPDIPQLSVQALVNNVNYGYVTGTGTFTAGQMASLKAIPRAGHYFVQWWENNINYPIGGVFPPFPVTQNRVLTAEFAPIGTPALTAQTAGYTSIKLNWTHAAGASGYEVWRATSSGGAYSKIKTLSGTSFTDTGRTTGKTYYYKVRAYATGTATTTGGFSPVKSAKAVPLAPSSIKAATAGYSAIKVSWAKVSGATKYSVYRATSANGTYSNIGSTSSTSYTDSGRVTGKTYYYKVRAYHREGKTNVYGNYTPYAYAKAVPWRPSYIKTRKASSTAIKVSWGRVSGATRYELWRAASPDGPFTPVKTTSSREYTDKGLKKGVTYYYKVRVYHLEGRTKVYSSYTAVTSRKL